MKWLVARSAIAFLILASLLVIAPVAAASSAHTPVPLVLAKGTAVPNSYIVVLKQQVPATSTLNAAGITMSGTSMASPHAAGAGALYKATLGDTASATIVNWIIGNATVGVLNGVPSGTPNRLLFIPASINPPVTVNVFCESGVSSFYCDGYVTGGTGVYTTTWTPVMNDYFTSVSDFFVQGRCIAGRYYRVQLTVYDSDGATGSDLSGSICRQGFWQ